MTKVCDTILAKQIQIDKNHIDNFVLEQDTGTKKLKEKFHQKAVSDRNNYINSRLEEYSNYKNIIYDEVKKRAKLMIPDNSDAKIEELEKNAASSLDVVVNVNENLPVSFKLGLNYLLSEINEDTGINKLNEIIKEFINKFRLSEINLTIDDFSYTMFTRKYISLYFEQESNKSNSIDFYESFQRIYYDCPKIVMQIKYNLINIIEHYEQQLKDRMQRLMNEYMEGNHKDKLAIEGDFIEKKSELMWTKIKDQYTLINKFTKGEMKLSDYISTSPVREKNFKVFEGDLDDYNFDEEMHELYGCLKEVKEYYRYEFILKDIIKRYNDKSNFKAKYDEKIKELNSCNKNRLKYLALYDKSLKKNIFGVVNREKQKANILKVNDTLINYDKIFNELEDIKFNKRFSEKVNDVSSIYDLFSSSLLSYSYLEKQFKMKFNKDDSNDEFNLEKEFDRYIRFLFDKYNRFLRKSNGFSSIDMPTLIADNYKLLGFTIRKEDVVPEKIDETIAIVKYIILVNYIEKSDLSFDKIGFIVKYNELQQLFEKDGIELL